MAPPEGSSCPALWAKQVGAAPEMDLQVMRYGDNFVPFSV
jgi:hypothetical protein